MTCTTSEEVLEYLAIFQYEPQTEVQHRESRFPAIVRVALIRVASKQHA